MAKKTSGKRAGKATVKPKGTAKAQVKVKAKAKGKAIRKPDGRIAKKVVAKVGKRVDGRYARKVVKKVGERVDGRYARKVVKKVGKRVDGRYARKVAATVSKKGIGKGKAKGTTPSRPRATKIGVPQRYEVIGTTADVAIKALGRTHDALFTNAALGLADLMCDSRTVQAKAQREVVTSADTPERLMVSFLTELLVLHEAEGFVYSSVEARVRAPEQAETKWRLLAVAMGETYEQGRHQMLHDVKAVTYHTLEVSPEKGYARVLFDI